MAAKDDKEEKQPEESKSSKSFQLLVSEKISAGLTKEQAEEVVRAQFAHEASLKKTAKV